MAKRYLTDLAEVCRRTGYRVIEVGSAPGAQGDAWKGRARGSGGYDSGRPTHIMIHHTASGSSMDGWPDVNYCTFSDEDAPLCNLYLSREPVIYVCAGGATNTNGSGQDPCGITPDDSMNSSAIGIEAGNNGVGERWPDAMLDCYLSLCEELGAAYGIAPAQVHAHAEWAPERKIDPAGPDRYAQGDNTWNMDAFRNDVGPITPPTPIPPTPPGEDDDMIFDGFWRRDNSDAVYAIFKDGHKQWMTDPGYHAAMESLQRINGAKPDQLSVRVQSDPAMFAAFGLVEGPREPGTDEWGNKV